MEQTDQNKYYKQLINDYCRSIKAELNVSDHTIRNYKNDLISFLMWCERSCVDPFKINVVQLRGYLAELDGAKYARSTTNRHLSSLRSFYSWLEIENICKNDTFSSMSGPKMPANLPHKVRSSDMNKLLNYCKDQVNSTAEDRLKNACAIRDLAIIELLYATGARISEVANLKISNIDLMSGQVKLLGKGNKERLVPLHNIAQKSILDYLETARPQLLHCKKTNSKNKIDGACINNNNIQSPDKNNINSEDIKNSKFGSNKADDICFLGIRGGAFSADSIRQMFYKKCKHAGIHSHVSPHSVRHSFASDVLEGGADLRTVQEMLGHASLSTTQIYTHLSTKKLKDAHIQAHPRG